MVEEESMSAGGGGVQELHVRPGAPAHAEAGSGSQIDGVLDAEALADGLELGLSRSGYCPARRLDGRGRGRPGGSRLRMRLPQNDSAAALLLLAPPPLKLLDLPSVCGPQGGEALVVPRLAVIAATALILRVLVFGEVPVRLLVVGGGGGTASISAIGEVVIAESRRYGQHRAALPGQRGWSGGALGRNAIRGRRRGRGGGGWGGSGGVGAFVLRLRPL
mmetsp:Transcript_7684/g.22570  ORF Transcript_7684/g.22570 Transcript_7684/m.22570 type:complete len:219 (+) Transcript_7684:1750-2406(+)